MPFDDSHRRRPPPPAPGGPGLPCFPPARAGEDPAAPSPPPGEGFPFEASGLKEIQRPGRYLGGETGAVQNETPDGRGRMFRVALAFPDVYEIAHSHLGHKILYALVNSVPGLSAERAYAPWADMEALLRARGAPLSSLETRRPLGEFGLVGFSLQYELGYTNVLNMLDLSGIPLAASERGESHPFVAAGGPGCANPEPMADFFDFFFLGDGEPNLASDLEAIRDMKAEGLPRSEILLALARRPGIYVPSLFAPEYESGKFSGAFTGIRPLAPDLPRPGRIAAPALSGLFFPRSQIVPFVKPVHDRVAVEIARGCSRGCRFCQAGYIYRPVRERGDAESLALAEANLASTGHDEAAFLSLSAGDHTRIDCMVRGFMDRWGGTGVSLSLPSMRVRSVTRALAEQIKRARKTGFTIAPEAATARLRAVVNKDLTEEDVLAAAETAFSLGWKTLKLYFMCGLPTETDFDLEAVGALAKRIKRSTRARLNVGLAHFTPKAHTPFQWERGSLPGQIRARVGLVKSAARREGIAVKHADPGASFAESLIARGDRRMGSVIRKVFESGARFEAWNDLFSLDPWLCALACSGFDWVSFAAPRDTASPLPWDHVFYGVDKPYLLKELERARQGLATPDCRDAGCLGCGACGGEARIDLAGKRPAGAAASTESEPPAPENGAAPCPGPAAGPPAPAEPPEAPPGAAEAPPGAAEVPGDPPRPVGRGGAGGPKGKAPGSKDFPAPPEFRYLARFEKVGRPTFLGHLELVELFKRAFRRGGLKLALSLGFHPSPKLSFMTALPLGVPSLDEAALFSLSEDVPPEWIAKALELPDGLRLTSLERRPLSSPRPGLAGSSWLVAAPSPAFRDPPLYPDAHLGYTDKKGRQREFKIRDYVLEARALSPERLLISIAFRETGAPKPLGCARALWGLEPSLHLELSKLKTLLS